MKIFRLLTISIITFFMLSFITISSQAQDEEIENIVETLFNIKFLTATDLLIDIAINPLQLSMAGEIFTYDQIKNANEQDLGSFRLLLFQMLESQLEDTFPNANILNFSRPVFEGETFNEQMNIELTSNYFSLNESINAYNFINGILDMNGLINYTFTLYADPGWNNSYYVDLGEELDYQRTTGDLYGEKMEWILHNFNGESPSKNAEFQIKKEIPTTKELDNEEISLSYELDSSDTQKTSLNCYLTMHKVNISSYDVLPEFVSNLNIIPADGIRLFVNNSIISWDDIYSKTVKPIQMRIKKSIEESKLNETLDLEFNWDPETTTEIKTPFSISSMDEHPPVRANIKDSEIDFRICGIRSRALFGLVNTNANINITKEDINFGDNLDSVGVNYNVSFHLPNNMFLAGENKYIWNETISEFGDIESNIRKIYDRQSKETIITLDLTTTDLNILGFFTGNTELSFGLNFKGIRNYNVTRLPNEFDLPEKIKIDYLNSDAIRLCIEEGVFSQNSVNNFLINEKEQLESILRIIMPKLEATGTIERDVFTDSLAWNGNISEMDSGESVVVSSIAKSTYPVPFRLSFLPPKFEIPVQMYNFTGIPNHDVTYRIIFPQGMNIDVKDPLNKAQVKQTGDGRDYISLTFRSNEANLSNFVTCTMTPSLLFIVGVFTPCIISFFITIILIIVIFLIRRKRRGGKLVKQPHEETIEYDGEDYYIPPPPPNKR